MDLSWLGQFDRVYCYARVSSTDQADKTRSIETQRARLSGIKPKLDRLYEDVQPGDEADRPDYKLLMEQARTDATAGLKVLIVITELSRLSRDKNVTDTIEYLEALQIVLFALDGGNITVIEPHNWLARSQEAMFNQYFLKQLRRNLRSSKAQKRVERRPLSPRPPKGYLWSKEKYLIDESMFATMRQLVLHYLPPPTGSGWSLRQCSEWAIANGVELKVGSLRAWFLNPSIRGHLSYSIGGYNREEQKRGIHNKPKEIAYNTHDPIISEAEYRAIKRRLQDNRDYARNGTNTPRYPLSGLIYCGYCDEKMTYHATIDKRYGRRYGNYLCRNRLCTRQNVSERVIETKVQEALASQAQTLAALQAEPVEETINPALLEIQRQLTELRALYDRSPLAGIRDAIAELEAQAQRLEAAPTVSTVVDLSDLIALFENPSNFNLLSLAEKRTVYHELVAKVTVKRSQDIVVKLLF